MKSYLLYGILLLFLIVIFCNERVSGFINYVAPYGNPLQKDWWKGYSPFKSNLSKGF